MTSSILIVVAVCLTSAAAQNVKMACKDGHGEGFYPNKFIYTPAAYDTLANLVDTNPLVQGSVGTVTTTSILGNLGSQQLTIYDNGLIAAGTPGVAPVLTGYSGQAGNILNQAFLTAVWYPVTDLDQAEVECRVTLRGSEYNGNDLEGGRICDLERMEDEILAWDFYEKNDPTPGGGVQPIRVDEMLLCTWKMTGNGAGDGIMYSQVAIGYTNLGEAYASMTYELRDGNSFAAPVFFKFNANYANANQAQYATVCGSTAIAGNSNIFCGRSSQVLFSLSDDMCTPADTCSSLPTDVWSRNPNCKALQPATDTCYAHGGCEYTYNPLDSDEVEFTFRFESEIVRYDRWEAIRLDTMTNTVGPQCALNAPANRDVNAVTGDVTITKTWSTSGISTCTQSGPSANGDYMFLLNNYDSNEVMGSMNGNHVWKMGSRQYKVTCRPADFVTQATIGVNIGNDVHEVTAPTSIPTLTLQIGNKLDYTSNGFATFGLNAMVGLGRPLYPYLCYNPGSDWVVNVHPYGVRGIQCRIADTAGFDNKVKTVLTNGCPNPALTAFRADAEFVSLETNADITNPANTFCATMGAIRAARWVTQNEIWLECTVDFCTNTGYYANSYCENSCTGNGYDQNGNRKKRQAEEASDVEPTRVVTVIRVSDSTEDDAQMSCADPTMAISAIVALVVLLLVATVIAVFLMLKMQSRRRKA